MPDFSNTNAEQFPLRYVHFNVQCLVSKRVNKLQSDYFKDLFENNDVLLFCETWSSELSELHVDGFEYDALHRTDKHKNSKRDSGGLVVYIRSCYYKYVSIHCKDSDDNMNEGMALRASATQLFYLC